MSTILDALKKSEKERKLNNIPTLSDMPAPQEKSRWPLSLLAVLALGLLIAIAWMLTGSLRLSGSQADGSAVQDIVISNETVQDAVATVQPAADVNPETVVVNVVSYSEDPETRFVIIGGKLFRENEFVTAGVKVEAIQPDSVILNQRGQRITRTP